MRTEERQKHILNVAKSEGFVSISRTAERLNVSVETIRRDINRLCRENQLKKAHGGAVPAKAPIRKDADYLMRLHLNQQEKIAIGAEAAMMIREGSVVALDCGVSVQAMAKCISGVTNVTFVTNSIPTAAILLDKIDSGEVTGRVILIGGEIETHNRFSKGADVNRVLERYHFDLAFISCTALSADGASSYTLEECAYSAQMIAQSTTTVLLAESIKLGKNSVCSFAKLTDFERIITDSKNEVPIDIVKAIEASSTKLVIINC